MKVLLVKLSSLGDVVHTLPVVQDIRSALPGASVDWVIERSFAPLLKQVPGLHRVVPCELRRWKKVWWTSATWDEWHIFKTQLQLQAYDAVIDLQGLTKSAIVARQARLAPRGRRFAMASQTEGSAYEAPTRWAADVAISLPTRIGALQRGRALAALALGYEHPPTPDFGLYPERVARSLDMSAMDVTAPESPQPTVAFVHGTSRTDKEWPLEHWVALGQHLNACGVRVALAHGNASELQTSQAIAARLAESVVWPMLPLDALTAALAGCCGVVGVDSGVSHIAVALNLPHVQIYNFDTAWRTGPDEASSQGRQVSVFAHPTPSVQTVCRAWQDAIADSCVKKTAVVQLYPDL